ncbi:MAG: hypothetical protein CL607_09195 [Anaerolineaceae bacterium]|nr:hypothetical protein [Anaerolineaceae bacterium]
MRHLFLLLCVCLIGVASVSAEDGIPDNCENPNSPYVSTNTFARYSNSTKQLWLVDWSTGDQIQFVDQFEDDLRIINWSPDCRYLVVNEGVLNRPPATNEDGSVDRVFWPWHSDPQIYVYDITTNERVYTGIGPTSWRITFVEWSPDSRRAVISTRRFRSIFWNADTGGMQEIAFYPYSEGTAQSQVYWDMARGWIWTNWGSVYALDINTGAEINRYQHFSASRTWNGSPSHVGSPSYAFSPDASYIVLYSQFTDVQVPGITVYPINQPDHATVLNDEGNGGRIHQFSQDNRYLAVSGTEAIRVWDLQNLPDTIQDRLPITRIPYVRGNEWYFIDATTIEIHAGNSIQHWNVSTGEQVQ